MTLAEIQAFVVAVDSTASHYESAYAGSAAYTVWREYRYNSQMADNAHQGGIVFQIDRFTKTENDAIAAAFITALEANPRISFEYLVDYERDTRYIHHIFDCEGI